MEPLTESALVSEVSSATYCFRNKIGPASVGQLWRKLSAFIADALKQQKGVLLPNLGTFRVGPLVGSTTSKVRPTFTLLETRYNGVSQERPKTAIGGRCPIIQPNYTLLANAAAVHRGACQRLLLELVQTLGAHILAGRPIQVVFPGLGRLFTNKANRVEFAFDQLLREYFELGRHAIIPEMPDYDPEEELEEEAVAEVVRGLQQVHLHNPPGIINPAVRTRPGASPPPLSPSDRVKRNAHAPYKGALLELYRLCKNHDRTNSGCVTRLQLEEWLHRECSALLRQVAAATVLDLLSSNTYGKTGRHVLYKPFMDQLEGVIGDVTPLELSPQAVQSPRRIVEVRLDSPSAQGQAAQQEQRPLGDEEVAEVTFYPGVAGPGPGSLRPAPLDLPHTPAMTPGPAQAWGQQQQHYAQPSPYQAGYGAGAGPGPGSSQGGAGASPDGQQMPHHYYQHHLSSNSRKEYDSFNKVHFDKLEQMRGRDYKSRAVTPKVGEDALNLAEYHAVRQVDGGPGGTPSPAHVLGLQQEAPYSRDTPQPIAHIPKHRGTPGPQPQILTLSHPTPSPSPSPPQHQQHQQPYPQHSPYGYQQQQPSYPHTPAGHQQQQPSPGSQQHSPYWQAPQQQQGGARQPWVSSPSPQQQQQQQQTNSILLDQPPPISQYEIINEHDPVLRQKKRAELARELQTIYGEQIRAKERVLQDLEQAESRWPYAPTGHPNDKRPISAVSDAPAMMRAAAANERHRPVSTMSRPGAGGGGGSGAGAGAVGASGGAGARPSSTQRLVRSNSATSSTASSAAKRTPVGGKPPAKR